MVCLPLEGPARLLGSVLLLGHIQYVDHDMSLSIDSIIKIHAGASLKVALY